MPRPPGDCAGVRHYGRPGQGRDAREALAHRARRHGRLRRPAVALQRNPLPLAGGHARDSGVLPQGQRPHGGRHDHGPAPRLAARPRRPVPPGEHRDRARPPASAELPRPRPDGAGGGVTAELQRFRQSIGRAATGEPLAHAEAREAFDLMMTGNATPSQVAGLVMALRVRGEAVAETTAGAEALRERMTRVKAPEGAIDTCGTGGDAAGTHNITTAAAIVVAGCGVPVAKHGNRGLSSRSGSSDVLTALGVNVEAEVAVIEEALETAKIGFMMAPRHHGAMRHVAGPRVELGTRTIFNLLGPLANPAGVKRQIMGVVAAQWVEPLAHVLGRLGCERAWVVHGQGLDELTPTGASL